MEIMQRIDRLNRLLIPKKVRCLLNITAGDTLALSVRENCIVIKKPADACALCGGESGLIPFGETMVCRGCRERLCAKGGESR